MLSNTLTLLTSIILFLTWTTVVADTPPQEIVIVASPADIPLTKPLLSTVATCELLLVNSTNVKFALLGSLL